MNLNHLKCPQYFNIMHYINIYIYIFFYLYIYKFYILYIAVYFDIEILFVSIESMAEHVYAEGNIFDKTLTPILPSNFTSPSLKYWSWRSLERFSEEPRILSSRVSRRDVFSIYTLSKFRAFYRGKYLCTAFLPDTNLTESLSLSLSLSPLSGNRLWRATSSHELWAR